MTTYSPGLHILVTFSADSDLLKNTPKCKEIFDKIIGELQLSIVGEVYHSFQEGGFTAVVCLTESHVSIHTWPEFGTATFDVFLSNYNNDNSPKARQFAEHVIDSFQGKIITHQEIFR